jgi:metal-sulfur cluster biosynthetic enzyme
MSDEEVPPAPAPPSPPEASPAEVTWTSDQVREILRGVYDPELHFSIVDLGLVYDIAVNGPAVNVQMTLTSPGCPYGPYLIHTVRDTLLALKGIAQVDVQVVWEPMWGPDKMSEEIRLELGFDV